MGWEGGAETTNRSVSAWIGIFWFWIFWIGMSFLS
jgi:hypothetical protein